MRILIVVPRQDGIDARPEISAVASGHEVTILDGLVTSWRLEDALQDRQYDVVHFAQHGQAGLLQLTDRKVTLEWLVRVFQGQQELRLVFLNACDSVEIGSALHNALGCAVVANKASISNDAALRLACDMYGAMAAGADVVYAFHEAKASLRRLYPQEADIPILINGHMWTSKALTDRVGDLERRVGVLERNMEEWAERRTVITPERVLLLIVVMLQIWQIVIR